MPGCVLHVNGHDFLVDEFLAGSSLRPYSVSHKGEVGLRGVYSASGFKVDVSNVSGDLAGQVVDAIAFLRSHQGELARLAAYPGVDDRRLDFGYDRRDVAVQCDYLPAELLALAGSLGIGIELSLYPPSCDESSPG